MLLWKPSNRSGECQAGGLHLFAQTDKSQMQMDMQPTCSSNATVHQTQKGSDFELRFNFWFFGCLPIFAREASSQQRAEVPRVRECELHSPMINSKPLRSFGNCICSYTSHSTGCSLLNSTRPPSPRLVSVGVWLLLTPRRHSQLLWSVKQQNLAVC